MGAWKLCKFPFYIINHPSDKRMKVPPNICVCVYTHILYTFHIYVCVCVHTHVYEKNTVEGGSKGGEDSEKP